MGQKKRPLTWRLVVKRTCVNVTATMLFFVVGSVGTMLWSNTYADDAGKGKPVTSTLKWEYKVISESTQPTVGLNTKKIEGSLNNLGEEGWECVGTVSEVKGGISEANLTNAVLIFKRPKK